MGYVYSRHGTSLNAGCALCISLTCYSYFCFCCPRATVAGTRGAATTTPQREPRAAAVLRPKSAATGPAAGALPRGLGGKYGAQPVWCVPGCTLACVDCTMIGCDTGQCAYGAWFHPGCVDVQKVPGVEQPWWCPSCAADSKVGKKKTRGGSKKVCKGGGCTTLAHTSGRGMCSQHAVRKRKACAHEGCTTLAHTSGRGMCSMHAVRKRKACAHEGCTTLAQTSGRGMCNQHAVRKACAHEGCTTLANVSGGGMCTQHAVRKACAHEGCTTLAHVSARMCSKHAVRKACKVESCTTPAHTSGKGLCFRHAARTACAFEGCSNNAKSRGVCVKHK